MDNLYGCAAARSLLAELATGAAAGVERASAIRHVAECVTCRSELAGLARTADSLLLLVPAAEPPSGFENSVIARLERDPAVRHRRAARPLRRMLAAAVAGLVAAALLGAGAVWWHTAPDRALATRTRHTLEVADGRYLDAAQVTTVSGATVGTVFLYQGNPSWLLVSMTAAPADGPYQVSIVGRGGGTYPIGTCPISNGAGTIAYRLRTQVASIAAIEMRGPNGVRLTARV